MKPLDATTAPDKAPDKVGTKDERGLFDRLWGKEGFSFGALLDIVNPLQHIPIIGTVYRAITGDGIGPAARVAGGTLFGGVIGLVAASLDSLVEGETGRDVGQHILAMKDDADKPADPTSPTGRPEREPALYAGDLSPRPQPMIAPTMIASTLLADTAPSAAQANIEQAAPLQTAARTAVGAPIAMPTPQTLAADAALLRQMQTTRAPANQPQNQPRNVGSIDTTIRAKNAMGTTVGASPTFLDYTPQNAALRRVETDVPAADRTPPAAPEAPPQKIDAGSFPQVPADLISRMNMALEKYQTMQRVTDRPAVNVTQ